MNAFLTALAQARPANLAPTLPDPTLPPCPLCGAAAVAGYAFDTWEHMAHVCACDTTDPKPYDAGLRVIARQRNALPEYLRALPALYQGYTPSALTRAAEQADAVKAVKGGLTGNLYLYGEAGTGKTHLAVAAAYRLAERGATARFWGMASLIKALRDSHAPGAEVARPALHHWDVLILDDIDKIKPTPYVYEAFYELIEARFTAQKVTIFTSQTDPNEAGLILTPDAAARAADPLASRMGSGHVFKISGEDRRGM